MRALLMSGLFASAASAAEFPPPSKLPEQPELPDPLVMFDGTKVASKDDWVNKRRPELKALFEHYMYGKRPAPMKVSAKVNHEDASAFGGKATLREVVLTLGEKDAGRINLLLVTPNGRKAPAPVFVGMNFSGNHSLVKDPKVLLPTAWMYPNRTGVKDNKATEEGRGTALDVWNIDLIIERGYAVATFYNGDIDPDRNDRREGIRPLWNHDGEQRGDETATVMAWSWGISRAVDYLETLKEIDPKRVIAVGHSRLGKTAILTAAFDERIALAIPHQAGCGGTAPDRCHNPKAETVKRINTSFPHWFDGNFKKFNDDTARLPFDQNCLVALCAPRPVLFSNATEDQWANPGGQFDVLKAADPVYRFLGAGELKAKEPPPVGTLSDGTLGYWVRPGQHAMTRADWQVFLDYADKHLGKP
jgi:dienelactone hydrolase